jgi:aminoglycoside phosphotransferase (APT) family kinase protein
MLFPAVHKLAAIQKEFARIIPNLPDAHQAGSPAQVIEACLKMLYWREHQNLAFIEKQEATLAATLNDAVVLLNNDGRVSAALVQPFEQLRKALLHHNEERCLSAREEQWRQNLVTLEQALVAVAAADEVSEVTRHSLAGIMGRWEAKDLQEHMNTPDRMEESDTSATDIDTDQWQSYLRERFSEADLIVTEFKSLSGGFGKQTILFSASGKALDGDYVIRRDYTSDGLENDCHTVDKEYAVIRAVHASGFPAPDALWLDTDHPQLPGGDFIVMRRSPGETGGTVFSSHQAVSEKLVDTLALACAQLHSLPPLTSLGNLTSSICLKSWQNSTQEVVHEYIDEWYRMYLSSDHTPSPALACLYGWLLDNIPQVDGNPVLLHGDIGFQNMLLVKGDLSCLVDWEFVHVGDPAEDLAYIKNTLGHLLDWDRFMTSYTRESGFDIDEKRLRYFQIWGQVRNATAANIMSTLFARGEAEELKLAVLPFTYISQFIDAAQQLIEQYEH